MRIGSKISDQLQSKVNEMKKDSIYVSHKRRFSGRSWLITENNHVTEVGNIDS